MILLTSWFLKIIYCGRIKIRNYNIIRSQIIQRFFRSLNIFQFEPYLTLFIQLQWTSLRTSTQALVVPIITILGKLLWWSFGVTGENGRIRQLINKGWPNPVRLSLVFVTAIDVTAVVTAFTNVVAIRLRPNTTWKYIWYNVLKLFELIRAEVFE